MKTSMQRHFDTAIFAGGCFWCTEAIFMQLKGVESVIPGYTGGHIKNPTYDQVCAGISGHAEAIKIEYDPTIITYDDLLDVFWRTHDPTTLNRQGHDVGTQYRSAIFYVNRSQAKTAKKTLAAFQESGHYKNPIVTQIVPASDFYPAEKYHHRYFENNRNQPYCRLVIDPKIQKLKKTVTAEMLKAK